MKRKELIRQLIKQGCILLRHGKKYDIYINLSSGEKQPIPRHTEIDDKLAKHIKRHLGVS